MMKLKTIASIAGFGLLGAVAGTAPAAAITIGDNSLQDWGVNIQDTPTSVACSTSSTSGAGCHNSFIPGTPVPLFANLLGTSGNKDQADTNNNYQFVGVLGGGQNFDVEWMGIARNGNTMYVAISTGQRPDNGAADYEPGDLKITQLGGNNSGAVYGIELGSTTGAAITGPGGAGTTWKLNGSAEAAGTSTTGGNAQIGQIYGGTGANAAVFRTGALGNAGVQLDTNTTLHSNENGNAPGSLTGTNNLVGSVSGLFESGNTYTSCNATQLANDPAGCNQHQIIELAFDITTLLSGADLTDQSVVLQFTWGPSCTNDLTTAVAVNSQGNTLLPEPASLALFGLGMLGLGFIRRRKAA